MPYFSVGIVPIIPNVENRGGKTFNPPSEAFRYLGKLDFERDESVGYAPGDECPEMLTGAFVDLRRPLVLRHEGKEYPVGPREKSRRIAFFSIGGRESGRSGVAVYGDREFSKEILEGELVIPSTTAPFITGNILLDVSRGIHPDHYELGLNYFVKYTRNPNPYQLCRHMPGYMEKVVKTRTPGALTGRVFGNVVEIRPDENGSISLIETGKLSATKRTIAIPDRSMVVMETNPFYTAAEFYLEIPKG